ncbi:MAG: hypothetical protein JWM17_1872, partial [Actinobacteria bacterium]|nr:hypothetical protein [Actinomycetota bacterium]
MLEPDRQIATFVMVTEPAALYDNDISESIEIAFDEDAQLTSDDFSTTIRSLVEGMHHEYSEQRHHFNWGATGLFSQTVLIAVGTGVASNALWAGVVALRNKALATRTSVALNPPDSSPLTADAAWEIFAGYLVRAFKVSAPTAITVEAT